MLNKSLLAIAATIAVWLSAARPALSQPAAPTAKAKSFAVRVTGTGKPMILIPGLTCSGDVWDSTVEHFKGRYQCHVLTLAGFAGQPPIFPPMMETIRKDLAGYIRAKKLEHPVIVGHSLGGFLSYWLAAEEPGLVGPVVAVDGVPFYSALMNPSATAESAKSQAEMMRVSMATQEPEQFVANNKMFLGMMITDPKTVDAIVPTCSKSDQKSVGQAMYELMTTDLRQEAAKIKVPVLLIGSGASAQTAEMKKTLEQSYEAQVAKIPNHRVVMAEKARHFIMFDDPAFLFKTMDEFLAANH